MELNTIPMTVSEGINFKNFHANRLFRDLIGKKIIEAEIIASTEKLTLKEGLEMYELTEIEKALSTLLALSSATPGEAAVAFMTLQNEEQQLQMGEFLLDNEQASGRTIVEQARCIARTVK